VIDGAWVFAAGVTAGIDGALRLAAEMRGDVVAPPTHPPMAHAPAPPPHSGTPHTPPSAILELARPSVLTITLQREHTSRRVAANHSTVGPASG
jgi:cyclohexyl-isocyanide hydratase